MTRTTTVLLFYFVFFNIQSVYAVDFGLFGDVTFGGSSDENSNRTFTLGALDLLTRHEISDRSKLTAEIVFEDTGSGFEVDVERFFVTRSIKDNFNISLGRFHTQLGLWNSNYHHGSLLQDTINRPFFLEFEDANEGIFQAHLIGLNIAGESDNFSYQMAYGNSNSLNTRDRIIDGGYELEINNIQDPGEDKSIVLRLSYTFTNRKTTFGVSGMLNNITESGTRNIDPNLSSLVDRGETLFQQNILGVDFRHLENKFYVLAELYQMQFEDNPNINGNTIVAQTEAYYALAYYTQVGFQMTKRLKVILRHEALDFSDNSTYLRLRDLVPKKRNIFALNYKLEESNAIRFEIIDNQEDQQSSEYLYRFQWVFLLL